jgi:prevent-host-death family protein
MKTVPSYEAKTHLPRLLQYVAKGEQVTITRHGVPIAILSPAGATRTKRSVRETIEAIKRFRKGNTLGGMSLRDLINEGRR